METNHQRIFLENNKGIQGMNEGALYGEVRQNIQNLDKDILTIKLHDQDEKVHVSEENSDKSIEFNVASNSWKLFRFDAQRGLHNSNSSLRKNQIMIMVFIGVISVIFALIIIFM